MRVTGHGAAAAGGDDQPGASTGEVELGECEVEVLSSAEPPPFSLDARAETDEPVRLRYRYLDLRTDRMQRNLRLRAQVNSALRRAMERQGFVEVETPHAVDADARGRTRVRDPVAPAARVVLRAASEPSDRQAAAHGWRAWTATTRSPGACATRTCARIASSSSPSSTSRRPSSVRPTFSDS